MHRAGLAFVVALYACGCGNEVFVLVPDDGGRPPDNVPEPCPADVKAFTFGDNGLYEDDAAASLRARIIDSNHPEPYSGLNDWKIAITDLNDHPLPDARLNWACAFMPTHNHGSNPKLVDKPAPGQLLLGAQNLSMEGNWIVKLWLKPDGEGEEFAPSPQQRVALDRNACLPTNGTTGEANIVFNVCVPVKHD